MIQFNTPRYLATDEAQDLCWYCGVSLTAPVANQPHKASTRTKDHVFPLSLGGTSLHNQVPCCNRCNGWKGARMLEEFRLVARPGDGDLALFYAEVREKELLAAGAPKHRPIQPFNDTLARKLKEALGAL